MKKIILVSCCLAALITTLKAQPVLYGSTYRTISKYTTATNTMSAVYTGFTELGGNYGGLMVASNGKLYGMSSGGGSYDAGTIYSFDPSTNAFSNLFNFEETRGREPRGSLMQATNGKLYGMTTMGGINGAGVIFSYDPIINAFNKVHDFNYTDGYFPSGTLMQASDGKLYGMTREGGNRHDDFIGRGVLFSFDPATNTYIKLFEFVRNNSNGNAPVGSLLQLSDGKLYGVTGLGGSNEAGVIFSFEPFTNVYSKIFDFAYPTGGQPNGLMKATNGKLYGLTAAGGSSGRGVIFSFNLSTNEYNKSFDFDYDINGASPFGNLMQASDGRLYGMNFNGGSYGQGIYFSLDISNNMYNKLGDFDDFNGGPLQSTFVELSVCTAEVCNGLDDDCDGFVDEGFLNTDGDNMADCVDPDDDNDGILDGADNCPLIANPGQADNDGDIQGDVCDADDDNDGVLDGADNCPFIANPGQADNDGDGQGDVCDADDDNDGILDGADNCPLIANPGQENNDGDGQGDVCDADDDNDGVLDGIDNCPTIANPDQKDLDRDHMGDTCDLVTNVAGALDAMTSDINSMVTQDWKNALITKLNAAKSSCTAGNIKAASNELNAFINQVNAKRGKGFTDAQANDLIERANAIINAMRNGTSDCGDAFSAPVAKSKELPKDAVKQLKNGMVLQAMPNPSTLYFRLSLISSSSQPINIRVLDNYGRVVETKNNVAANGTHIIGQNFRPGIYHVEVLQGNQKTTTRLIKQPN